MKGIDGDQWEDDEHDKDFNPRVNDGRCGKIFQCLNLKYCLRRKSAQDYQAPLANIFKRQISHILKWLEKKKKILSSKHSLCLLPFLSSKHSREQISKFSKIFKSSNLGFFPFLFISNMCDSQAFHLFDCLWRLNLKNFQNEEANLITCF